ncbi:unnamed protein product [Caenorhabditis angaria]|uniref:Uncharacterized protein n=1 Tax=Caenorhabditis angaria TaxID=860376 RepID=A0A9P1MU32_9PELO|nr:unnamed protein product [Caenorhabditis angaria]
MEDPMIVYISKRDTPEYQENAKDNTTDEFHIERVLREVPYMLTNLFSTAYSDSFDKLGKYLTTLELNLTVCGENIRSRKLGNLDGFWNYIEFENYKHLKQSQGTLKNSFSFMNFEKPSNSIVFYLKIELVHIMGWRVTKTVLVKFRKVLVEYIPRLFLNEHVHKYLVTDIHFSGDCYDKSTFNASNLLSAWVEREIIDRGQNDTAEQFMENFTAVISDPETYEKYDDLYFSENFNLMLQVAGHERNHGRKNALEYLRIFFNRYNAEAIESFPLFENGHNAVFRISVVLSNRNIENFTIDRSFHIKIIYQHDSKWKIERIIVNRPIPEYNVNYIQYMNYSKNHFIEETGNSHMRKVESIQNFTKIANCDNQVVYDFTNTSNPDYSQFIERFAGLVNNYNFTGRIESNLEFRGENQDFAFKLQYYISNGKLYSTRKLMFFNIQVSHCSVRLN